jgi:hypothetical protein
VTNEQPLPARDLFAQSPIRAKLTGEKLRLRTLLLKPGVVEIEMKSSRFETSVAKFFCFKF